LRKNLNLLQKNESNLNELIFFFNICNLVNGLQYKRYVDFWNILQIMQGLPVIQL